MNKDNMLTVRQVAERLQVSGPCVYALIARGRLTAHRIGTGRGTIRVSDQDLVDYLQSCRQAPPQQEPLPKMRPRQLKHLKLS